MKFIPTVILGLLAAWSLQAQGQLGGLVADEKSAPIELATVLLRMADDTTIQAAAYTEADGRFSFPNLSAGVYVVEVSYVGYTRYVGSPVQVGPVQAAVAPLVLNITLQPNAAVLEQVTVTAKTPYIERRADRTIVHVDALIANAGSSALEALERSPGVSLDPNGAILLRGRAGVQIFIDDKPTYLSGQELENYLRSLPAGSVKQIEIMTNPPARYEAAGNAGVINIVTRRSKLPGFNGNLALNYTQGRYARTNNSFNLDLNRGKISAYANLNLAVMNRFQDLNINRYYKNEDLSPASSFSQNSYIKPADRSAGARLGLDYYLNEQTVVGLSFKGLLNPSESDTDNTAFVRNATGELSQIVLARNLEEGTFNNGAYNLNFRRNLDDLGSRLVLDADYVTYESVSDQVFNNRILDNAFNVTYADRINGRLPSSITISAAKLDYSKAFSAQSKLELGWKSAFTQTDNEAAYTTTIGGITNIDYSLSNRFLYDEWIHAAYANYTTTLGSFDLQAGLRAETTRLEGNQLGNEQNPAQQFTRDYTSLFPTFYATWRLDSLQHHVLSASYGKRIDRPFFQDLNPFIRPLDKFTFYAGNPNLLPTFSHNLSLTHSYKGFLNTTLSYAISTDGINETLEIRNGIYYSRPGNISTSESFSLSVDANFNLAPWYKLIVYAEGGYLAFSSPLYNQQLDTSGFYSYLSLTNSFVLGHGWNAELRANYNSNVVYAQLLIKSFGTLNFAVSKKVTDQLSLKFSASDILYTRRADGIINNLERTDADWDSRLDTRALSLTLSYRFGKAASGRQKFTGSGSEEEQNRVRN